jgi:Mce-associated membrane protein
VTKTLSATKTPSRTKTPISPPSTDEVDVTAETPPPVEPTDAAPAVSEPPRPLWGLTPTLALTLAVMMLLILALVGWGLSNQHSTNRSHAATQASSLAGPQAVAAETAASNETRATLTYSYKHLAADFATAEKGLTPAFAANYRSTTAQKVTPLATRYHAVSTAVVSDAGISALTATTATVLVFADQTVTNSQLPHPRLDRSRIKVFLTFSGGRWLISNLKPI